MNKYNKNILAITLITIFSLILMSTWLELDFGFAQILLIIGLAYAVYLNFKGFKEEQREVLIVKQSGRIVGIIWAIFSKKVGIN